MEDRVKGFMVELVNKVEKTIEKHQMIQRGDRIVVGVSGGADSICLLDILYRLKPVYDIVLTVVHVNHGLRGIEAKKDAAYVHQFCQIRQIPIYLKSVDVEKVAKQKKISQEAAGRLVRYESFFDVAKKTTSLKIAVAHHINDQAETILMRFMRGSGLKGLGGIEPVRKDGVIRPLIEVKREEIEDYCAYYGLEPQTDQTNFEPIYTRNKVRLQLMPQIIQEYNAAFVSSVAAIGEMMRCDNDFIESYTDKIVQKHFKADKKKITFRVDVLLKQHQAIRTRLVRKAVQRVKGNMYDLSYKHVKAVLEMATKRHTGLSIDLPGGIRSEIVYTEICFYPMDSQNREDFCQALPIGEKVYIKACSGYFLVRIVDKKGLAHINLGKFIKAFDYNVINEVLYIRNRLPGDKITPLGMKGTKKIKDLLIDLKVPRSKRDSIPLVTNEKDILWLVGYQINEKYKYIDTMEKAAVIAFFPDMEVTKDDR